MVATNSSAKQGAGTPPPAKSGKVKPALTLNIPAKTKLDTFLAGAGNGAEAESSTSMVASKEPNAPIAPEQSHPVAVVPAETGAQGTTNAMAVMQTAAISKSATEDEEELTEVQKNFIIRLSPAQKRRIEEVYNASTYKSLQKMGESMLMNAVEELGKSLKV